MVMAANDEFFAPKERLLEPAPPVFEPGRYTDRGKWMDGWETRRRRDPGHDWAAVRLGVPGVVRGVVVDTTHFRGNFPEAFSLDGLAAEGGPAADAVWAGLTPQDWLEAFTAHPRIGERRPTGDPRRWSAGEQAGAAGADAVVLDALAEGNRAYEQRFGRVFLICATGRSAAEMLADLRQRLGHDPETELRVAAEEQRKITRLRLDKLVRP
jgi:OHCU decarboxylase